MATLKSLVDETTNIKNELKSCHSNLKNNLINKGVSISSGDKLSTLVNKTNELGVKINKQSGELVLNNTNSSYDIAISKIDLNKSVCFGVQYDSNSYNAVHRECLTSFKNNTTLNISRNSTSVASSAKYYWEVLEFQSGVKKVYNFTTPQFTSVATPMKYSHNLNLSNPEKCLVYYSYKTRVSTSVYCCSMVNLTKNDITIKSTNLEGTTLNVFIVELN